MVVGRHPAIRGRSSTRAAWRSVVDDPLSQPAGLPAAVGPMKRQVAGCGSRRAAGRGPGSRVVRTSPTEKSATRITVVDIDLTHGRPADVLSTNSLSTDRLRAGT